MTNTRLALAAVALAGTLATGAAQARGGNDVQWSISIASPIGIVLHGGNRPVVAPYFYAPRAVHVAPRPIYYVQPAARHGHRRGWQPATRWDRDGDGIPNRHDRVYNPRGDRDRDGVPNWRDRRDRPDRGR